MFTRIAKPDARFPAFMRFREVGGRYVVTSQAGDYVILERDELERVASGTVEPGSELEGRLAERNLVRAKLDPAQVAQQLRDRKRFLHFGPNLHILVVTLRCNETCVYCHASRRPMDAVDTDMSPAIAKQAVDFALSTTNPSVTIEFQGGEPLVNFDVMRCAVDYALERNREIGKQLEFTLVSNLALMDDLKLRWLLDHKVQVCTSVDGPAELHDKQRKLPNASAHAAASEWIRRINSAYEGAGLDPEVYRVEALLTTTRDTLARWKQVVDSYVDLGCRALFLRPLDPFGFVGKTGHRIDYSTEEFLAFYRSAVDYILELNRDGVQILERFAAIFLTKILGAGEPNYLDIRSPCGAGIGQVAYNYDGRVFTCDEGRMMCEEGDDSFQIGWVGDRYRRVMGHETVRAMAIASNLDGQPDCVHCAYNPYCGVCPVHNYKTQGSLFGRMRDSSWCAVHKGIQDYLFEKIAAADSHVMSAFEKWITVRDRSHYLHT